MEKLNSLASIQELIKKMLSPGIVFPMPEFMVNIAREAEEFNKEYKPLYFKLIQKYGASAAVNMVAGYHKAGQQSVNPSAEIILKLMREAVNAPKGVNLFCSDCSKITSHELHWYNGGVYEGHVWRCRKCQKHGAWVND